MIIVRSPLRISLGGGGTDLPSYYEKHGGFLVSASINQYVYVTVLKPFSDGIHLKYSKLESVKDVNDINHPILKEALKLTGITSQIEITSLADIPSGTGLGSSGSFTVAVLKALYAYRRKFVTQEELAELACEIELNKLREPIGKQDQYAAAIGGITSFSFDASGRVGIEPLKMEEHAINLLEDNLLLFFTGYSRSASSILKTQNDQSISMNPEMIGNLDYVKQIGRDSKEFIERGDLESLGKIMHEHWRYKKMRSLNMTNTDVDTWYSTAIKNGAYGGKIVGAGGGGFLLFVASDKDMLRRSMVKLGLREVRFKFDFEGAKTLIQE